MELFGVLAFFTLSDWAQKWSKEKKFFIFLQFPVHFSNIQDNGRFSKAYLITRRLNIFLSRHENQISKIVFKTSVFYKSVGGD